MITASDDEPVTPHGPDRSTFDCRDCKQPWPCEPARTRLIREMADNLNELSAQMWVERDKAVMGPLRNASMGVLGDRFLRWIPLPKRRKEAGDAAKTASASG